MSIESVPAVHHHIFLSVTYSLEISPSKKSGALSLESNVALGSAIRLALKNRLSENCLKRSGQKAGRISYYPMMTFFFPIQLYRSWGLESYLDQINFLVSKSWKIKTKPIEKSQTSRPQILHD